MRSTSIRYKSVKISSHCTKSPECRSSPIRRVSTVLDNIVHTTIITLLFHDVSIISRPPLITLDKSIHHSLTLSAVYR